MLDTVLYLFETNLIHGPARIQAMAASWGWEWFWSLHGRVMSVCIQGRNG